MTNKVKSVSIQKGQLVTVTIEGELPKRGKIIDLSEFALKVNKVAKNEEGLYVISGYLQNDVSFDHTAWIYDLSAEPIIIPLG